MQKRHAQHRSRLSFAQIGIGGKARVLLRVRQNQRVSGVGNQPDDADSQLMFALFQRN